MKIKNIIFVFLILALPMRVFATDSVVQIKLSPAQQYESEMKTEFEILENTWSQSLITYESFKDNTALSVYEKLDLMTTPMDTALREFKFIMRNDKTDSFVNFQGVKKSGISRLLIDAGVMKSEHEKIWSDEYNKINQEYRKVADIMRLQILNDCKNAKNNLENKFLSAAADPDFKSAKNMAIESYRNGIQELYKPTGECFDVPPQYKESDDKVLMNVIGQETVK